MSTFKKITKCDICGEYGCDYDGRLKIKQRKDLWWESWMTRFDICPKCSRLMKEWIKMKKDSETAPTVTKAFAIGRNAVLTELHAQVAIGNLTEAVAGDIIAHLFNSEAEENKTGKWNFGETLDCGADPRETVDCIKMGR